MAEQGGVGFGMRERTDGAGRMVSCGDLWPAGADGARQDSVEWNADLRADFGSEREEWRGRNTGKGRVPVLDAGGFVRKQSFVCGTAGWDAGHEKGIALMDNAWFVDRNARFAGISEVMTTIKEGDRQRGAPSFKT